MKNYLYACLFLTASLSTASACANEISNLKTSSMAIALEFSKQTQAYIDKNGTEKAISAAKESIKLKLKDPESAKFKDLQLVEYAGGKVICGSINAKNSFGGYTGFTRFIACPTHYIPIDNSSEHPKINEAANAGLYAACGK